MKLFIQKLKLMNDFFKLYLELLEYEDQLRSDNLSLEKVDKQKYRKRLDCLIKLSDFIHWQQKDKYLKLMENFVNFEINGKQFRDKFRILHKSIQNSVEIMENNLTELNNLELDPKSFGFTEWTSEIDLGCDEFYPDFKPETNFQFARDEENFRDFVAQIIPKIEEYL